MEEADIVVEVRCAEELRKLCREKAIVTLVDPAKSTVQGDGIKSAEINKLSKVTLHTKSPNGKPHKKPVVVKAKLITISSGSVVEPKVKQGQSGTSEIEYTPCVRGRHQLEVTVNGLPVAGSPFPVLVKTPSNTAQPLGTRSICRRSRKYVFGYIAMYNFSAVYFLYFLQALFVSDFTSRTPNKDEQVEQLTYCRFV